MKKFVHTVENESSKWFRRFFGVIAAMVVIFIFLVGFSMIASAIIIPSHYSILGVIIGIAMIYYSSKSIDKVLLMFGYKNQTKTDTVVKTRPTKKR